MQLKHGWHLAYCTNIHRGEDWGQTFQALQRYTLAIRERVAGGQPYAIGLRLSHLASLQLSEPSNLRAFQRWLDEHHCYIFTINGFPYGAFHGTRVKEQVYAPDWTSPDRVVYTKRLFDLLAQLVPDHTGGSISTVPCSFKEFIHRPEQERAMREHLWDCVEHIAQLSARTGKDLHLGLEPEPLCYLETSTEAVRFFEQMRGDRPKDDRLDRHLGINYDACHLAVEYEEPQAALRNLREAGIRLSKVHLSNALQVRPSAAARMALAAFADPVYFHQVIERDATGQLQRYRDLDAALAQAPGKDEPGREWRIHFHIPLHSEPTPLFGNTAGHLLGLLDELGNLPELCTHFEMETYTWEVMPPDLKQRDVVDQLSAEYGWTLGQLAERGAGLVPSPRPQGDAGLENPLTP